ncbi:hypothetical protein [Kitasatospora terrestris]|uniref:hypothetical protein n=1 Tax=Kitasatospora terrestris TaxID=258051 RepID=UPI0031F13943
MTTYSALTSEEQPTSARPGATAPPPTPRNTATPIPLETYSAPATWTEPTRWQALPRGSRAAANGRETGFPDSVDGAVAMLVAASAINAQGSRSLADEQWAIYAAYTASSEQSAALSQKVREGTARTDASTRAAMGLETTGPMPSGAHIRSQAVGFKIIRSAPGIVSTHLLVRSTQKAGELQPEKVSYIVCALSVAWREGDWKFTARPTSDRADEAPAIAAPGDAAFNSAGWTAIRQAS